MVTWDLTVNDEGLEEKNEKLRLSLRDPVNTIISDKRKMGIRIINAQHGMFNQQAKFYYERNLIHFSCVHFVQNAILI